MMSYGTKENIVEYGRILKIDMREVSRISSQEMAQRVIHQWLNNWNQTTTNKGE